MKKSNVDTHNTTGTMSTVLDFYENVVSCHLCSFPVDTVLVDQRRGFIPRGFYSEGRPGGIQVMVVGQNPGVGEGNDFRETAETRLYRGKSAREQTVLSMKLHKVIMKGEISWGSPFSRTIQEWLIYITDLPADKVWKHAVLTQALKCTTPKNSNPGGAREKCAKAHLENEIQFWKPKLILAAGKWAREALQWAGCRRFLRVYHPAGLKSNLRREENKLLLQEARKAYQRIVNQAN